MGMCCSLAHVYHKVTTALHPDGRTAGNFLSAAWSGRASDRQLLLPRIVPKRGCRCRATPRHRRTSPRINKRACETQPTSGFLLLLKAVRPADPRRVLKLEVGGGHGLVVEKGSTLHDSAPPICTAMHHSERRPRSPLMRTVRPQTPSADVSPLLLPEQILPYPDHVGGGGGGGCCLRAVLCAGVTTSGSCDTPWTSKRSE